MDIPLQTKSPEKLNSLDKLTEDLKSPDHAIRAKAASQLGSTGFSQAVKPLLELLNTDEFPSVRKECALALANLKDSRAFSCLCDTLTDPDPSVRKAAVTAIAGIQDLRTPHKLAEMLADEDMRVRREAAACLTRTGSAAIEPAIKCLKSENPIVRWNAATLLGNSHDPRALEPLLEVLLDHDSSVRRAAIDAVAKLRNPLAFETLADILKSEHYDDKYIIADMIDKIGGELALKPLTDALASADERLLISCISALGRLKMSESIPAIYPFIFHKNPRIREQSALSYQNIPNSPEYLINKMGKSDGEQRELIAQALEKMEEPVGRELQMLFSGIPGAEDKILARKDPRTSLAILAAIKHGTAEVKIPAIRLLGKTGSSQSRDFLIELLKQNNDSDVSGEIIKSIGEFSGKKGMETLMGILDSSAPAETRLKALQAISSKATTAELAELLRLSKNAEQQLSKLITETVDSILKKNASLADKWQTLFCPKCLARFEKFKESLSLFKSVTYYACRRCRGEKFIEGAVTIEAVIDIHVDYFIAQEDDTIKINWLKKKLPIDFDRIEIGAADDKILKAFIEVVQKDPNPANPGKKHEVTANEDCTLSAKKIKSFGEAVRAASNTGNPL
ncbi:MAG: HEAT repeat domain-containing protein [Firmicutes bacterium]|nr:HEAT repeat domain-containing protein [Bacillota bacterium]